MEEMDVLEIEIDKELKEQAEALLQKIGMDLETAIILFIEECNMAVVRKRDFFDSVCG